MVEQRNNWNDDRLDELSGRVDAGFTKVDQKIDAGFAKVDAQFEKVDKRFEKVEGEMKEGFARVDKRFEKVEGEMKEGFEKAGQQLERAAQGLSKQMNEGFASLKGQTEARMDRIESRRAKFQGGVWGILGYAGGSIVTAVVTHFT